MVKVNGNKVNVELIVDTIGVAKQTSVNGEELTPLPHYMFLNDTLCELIKVLANG